MALFQKKPATGAAAGGVAKPKPDPAAKVQETMQKVRALMAESAREFILREFSESQNSLSFSESKVRRYAEREIRSGFSESVALMLGLERDYNNRYRVRWDSPLKRLLDKVVAENAEAMVAKAVAADEKRLPKHLPAKYREALDAAYEEAYLRALKEAAEERARVRAKDDLDALLSSFTRAPAGVTGAGKTKRGPAGPPGPAGPAGPACDCASRKTED